MAARTRTDVHDQHSDHTDPAVQSFTDRGMGWLPDIPDFRDYTTATPEVADLLALTAVAAPAGSAGSRTATAGPATPKSVDLRPTCSPIEDQGSLGSCTAQAAVGVLEYFARAAFGRHEDLSRRFVYKVTREMMGWTGDTGAFLRSAMGALAAFGAPPEQYWPYDVAAFEDEPSAFAYAYAQNYKAVTYYRLDPSGTTAKVTLDAVKAHLASGLPAMFGFAVYSSYPTAGSTGKLPFPARGERQVGGHAVVAVGYDDAVEVVHPTTRAKTTGALLIRNSWGVGWGMAGYGWLPYEYLLKGLAEDFWVLVKADWLNTGQFAQTVH